MSEPRRRYSDDDVAAILKRAAELSASSPAGRGASLEDIERIAEEAGLDPALVRRAARELGSTEPPSWVEKALGGPTAVVLEAELDGEVDASIHGALMEAVHRTLGEPGHMSAAGGAFTWGVNNQNRKILVSVMPRGGKTTVRVEEKLGILAGGIWGGLGGGLGGSLVPLAGIAAGTVLIPIGVVGVVAGALGATYFGTRAVFSAASQKRKQSLQVCLGELTAIIEDELRAKTADTRTLADVRDELGMKHAPSVPSTEKSAASQASSERAEVEAGVVQNRSS